MKYSEKCDSGIRFSHCGQTCCLKELETTYIPLYRYTEAPSIHRRMWPSASRLQSSRCPASLPQVIPFICTMSSRHLFIYLPRDLLPYIGCQSVILFVHLLSLSLATWPAHLHSCLAANLTTSLIFVFALISRHSILSFNFAFNIFLSIALCAILSLWVVALVNDHVWHP